jgi:hypothetical protein
MENTSSVIDTTTTELPILEEPVTEPVVVEEPVVTEPVVTEEPVTEPVVIEEPVVTEPVVVEEHVPSYITSLEELLNTTGVIRIKEDTDKTSLLSVFQPSAEALKSQLIVWATLGFIPDWAVFRTQINLPSVCSDGQTRLFYDYISYLLGSPIASFLSNLNSQVPGVTFGFFRYDATTIGLSVVKA